VIIYIYKVSCHAVISLQGAALIIDEPQNMPSNQIRAELKADERAHYSPVMLLINQAKSCLHIFIINVVFCYEYLTAIGAIR